MIRHLAASAVASAAVALVAASPSLATTYYVSPLGNDSATGTSSTSPWQSVSRVNSTSLKPGDSVLFGGGSSFVGQLQPPSSGVGNAPITFASYGGGQANVTGGIFLRSRSWLVFDGLRVDTGAWRSAGSTRGVTTASDGTGVSDITIRNCSFVNVALGLMAQNQLDTRWLVSKNLIQYTRDSGILIYDPNAPGEVGGSAMTFDGNQILDTGLDTSLNYKKHAVYDIGHDLVWRDNVIRRFSEGGFSLRARGNVLEGNTITDGPYAIYYSPYDPTAGTTLIAFNRIARVTEGTVTVDSTGLVSNSESYTIVSNSISASGTAPGIRVIGTQGSISVANNAVQVVEGPALRVDTVPGGGLVERANLWWRTTGPVALGISGTTYSDLPSYRAATGRGQSDRIADPLFGTDMRPDAASPVVDAGIPAVGALTYVGDCTGEAWHYCGALPDLGAVETSSPSPATIPPPPPPSGSLLPPTSLAAPKIAPTSVALSWFGSPDPRATGYEVLQGSTVVGRTSTTGYTVGSLGCGMRYDLGVRAVSETTAASAASYIAVTTASCTPTLTVTSPLNAQTVATKFTVYASASDPAGIRNVTFWFDGNEPCVDTLAPYASCLIKTVTGGHTIRVRATATDGRYAEQKIQVWADARRTLAFARPAVAHPRALRVATKRHRQATAKPKTRRT